MRKIFRAFTKHVLGIGFTNRMAVYLILLMAAMMAGGYHLARLSIGYGYVGQLLCYTVVATPMGTAMAAVLGKITDKSKAENTEGGCKYAAGLRSGWQKPAEKEE